MYVCKFLLVGRKSDECFIQRCDTIRYDTMDYRPLLTCAQKLMSSQLNLPHGMTAEIAGPVFACLDIDVRFAGLDIVQSTSPALSVSIFLVVRPAFQSTHY